MYRRWLIPLLIVLAVASSAWLVVLLLGEDDGSSADGEPQIVTVPELADLAAGTGHPVYWLGPQADATYELTETAGGRIFVRYLEQGAVPGDERAEFVTVGTYPVGNGVAALRRAARERGPARLGRTDDGAVLLIDPSSPENAHLAYPGSPLQIEVFSPVPGDALRLASEGRVTPVVSAPGGG